LHHTAVDDVVLGDVVAGEAADHQLCEEHVDGSQGLARVGDGGGRDLRIFMVMTMTMVMMSVIVRLS
jgi:hypothetical protein